jgi:hypothetical protein
LLVRFVDGGIRGLLAWQWEVLLLVYFVDCGIRVLLFSSLAYIDEGLIAIVCALPKPNNYATSSSIDFRHRLNLLFLFVFVFLVDANSIYPYDTFNKAISKV